MRARPYVIVLCLIALLLPAFTLQSDAAATESLVRVMKEIAALNDSDHGRLKEWASEGARRPSLSYSQVDKVKNNILNLEVPDRHAVVEWLRGGGPQALYARGISASQIRKAPVENPWRQLKLASETLQPAPSGDIQVLRGFAAVRKDGTAAQACVTFKNAGSKTASRIVFEFALVNGDGKEDGVLTLDRRGTFSPNIDIVGESSPFSPGTTIMGNRSFQDNCTTLTTAFAAVPILSAEYAGYRITRVEYADGTSWVP
jgi:hypothetical protein